MQHRARKRFGQNFLQNQHVIDSILDAFHPTPLENVLEIGPGLGALTKPLLRILPSFTAIEIDRDLYAHLTTEFPALRLLNEDALSVDYSQLGQQLRIIGNLPYNISTPLLLYLLGFKSHILDMHFMLQKEVVERLAAVPGTKAYGRLSVMVQYHAAVEQLFIVLPTAFHPMPKVESAVVRITPYHRSPFKDVHVPTLEKLLAMAFSMRRKTIANNLKPLLNANDLLSLGIDPVRRPEQISVAEYVHIANFIDN